MLVFSSVFVVFPLLCLRCFKVRIDFLHNNLVFFLKEREFVTRDALMGCVLLNLFFYWF